MNPLTPITHMMPLSARAAGHRSATSHALLGVVADQKRPFGSEPADSWLAGASADAAVPAG